MPMCNAVRDMPMRKCHMPMRECRPDMPMRECRSRVICENAKDVLETPRSRGDPGSFTGDRTSDLWIVKPYISTFLKFPVPRPEIEPGNSGMTDQSVTTRLLHDHLR
ncbi:hypothetical protein DPMN_007837 [Dreissena polymorpha]|uniref:Uncharacterized protein n=1 Tax=Dreissena polymorpha TaxID=45954 RepID=A0A9D4MY34_DREPO|nr:hypothetical protein DPMN_007837 [Dreissena polymorpha]